MKDYCYRKVKKKFKVFPSRYAGFALARCRRKLSKNPNDEISFLYNGKSYSIRFSSPNNYPIIKGLRTYVDPRTVDSAYPTKYEKWKSIDPFGKLGKILLKTVGWDWESRTIRKNPVPPKAVARVACRGLKKRRKYKRGGTAVGVARARDLCNRKNVSMRTIKRTFSYFSRHRASRAENRRRLADPVSPARIADELWGGTPGYRWVKKVLG